MHLAAFALSIVIPLWCLLGFLAWTSVGKARSAYQQQTTVTARNLALEVDRELAGFTGILRALATSPALVDGDLRRFHDQAARVTPQGSAVVLRDRAGQQLVNTLLPFGTPLPVTAAQAVLDADACVFRTQETCVSDLYIGTTDRQPYVVVDAPVFVGGSVRFALNIGVRASHLAALLAAYRVPPGWAVSIIDRQDRIIARSLEHDRFVGSLANAALRASADDDEGSVRSINVAGVPVWGAYVRLPASGWRIAIGVPEAVLDQPLRKSLLHLAGAGLFAVGLSVAAALVVGRRLAQPVGALARMAGTVGSATPPTPVHTAVREFMRVSRSLAEADARLQASKAERDEAQAALRLLNEDLRARVEEAVAAREEAQARLAQAQRMEALGQLAGGIAHDFNNVLQAVQGGARLIEGQADGPGPRPAAGVDDRGRRRPGRRGHAPPARLRPTRRPAGRAGGFRRAAGDHAGDPAPYARCGDRGPGAGRRPGVPALLADRGQLETVLVNLASNARDAMGGAGVVTLSAVPETVAQAHGVAAGTNCPSPGAYVRLSVADTGTGMDAATLARAAEPFFTTKPHGEGTGLGLAMARGFAQQSGGALRIESRRGPAPRSTSGCRSRQPDRRPPRDRLPRRRRRQPKRGCASSSWTTRRSSARSWRKGWRRRASPCSRRMAGRRRCGCSSPGRRRTCWSPISRCREWTASR